jgi:uncharacterized protein involved in outer membrane biogenesis
MLFNFGIFTIVAILSVYLLLVIILLAIQPTFEPEEYQPDIDEHEQNHL